MTTPTEPVCPEPAPLLVLEVGSLPRGLLVLDQMAKEAEVHVRWAGDVDPSRFLIVLDGDLSALESALDRGLVAAGDRLVAHVLLPQAHPRLLAGLDGVLSSRDDVQADELALGALESYTISGVVRGTDRALKIAPVRLVRLRFATQLGGQGHAVIAGEHADVEVALDAAAASEPAGVQIETTLIARPAAETALAATLGRGAFGRFGPLNP
jgi:microcompartment protein CcmL/EutN